MEGVPHTVEVTAGTLDEAVVQGLAKVRGVRLHAHRNHWCCLSLEHWARTKKMNSEDIKKVTNQAIEQLITALNEG